MPLYALRYAARAVLLVVLLLASSRLAAASEPEEIRNGCWASGALSETVAAVAQSPERWTCGSRDYSIEGERVLLRYEVEPGASLPRYFFSRSTALQAVHLVAIDADGSMRETSFASGDLLHARQGGFFKAPLPDTTAETQYIVAAIDLPSHRMTLDKAYLATDDLPESRGSTQFVLFLAGLCGMLAMPLVFNLAFYRVLRESFVLWHSALTISLMLTILVSSELSQYLIFPAMTLSWMETVVFGFTVASGAMFTYTFIEPGRMHPWLRRALPYCAAWAMLLSSLHALFPFVGRSVQSTVYTAAFAPVLVIFMVAMVDALRRGSRAAKFQAVGWAPMVGVGLTRLITGLVPGMEANDAMLLFYVGCVCEVLSTALGVADRFMSLKHQRDSARTEAELLEWLSERDALTGLLNRRALEGRFAQFRADGFDTLAVLDLDHFKAINDVYGHAVGDTVLKATADALQADRNVCAFRLGGEEFVLLLRGDEVNAKAERRRRAIPAIVARAVPGLQKPVTASMGVVDLANASADAGFAELFERADKLLYEAKIGGRNRAVFDRQETGVSALAGRTVAA